MLLLIDAGNTRVKWALVAEAPAVAGAAGLWLANGAVGHAEPDGLSLAWQQAASHMPVTSVLVSNVAGAPMRSALSAQLERLQAHSNRPLAIDWFASEPMVAGVTNHYRNPRQLGCDRLASLIGARALHPDQALIVATCGTATTVDALTADGDFIGGMILPGLATMAGSLAQRTAQLPAIRPRPMKGAGGPADADANVEASADTTSAFADNTDDAIHNGCVSAQAGAIERAVAEHGNAHCLLSGGAAAWIAPWLQVKATLVENLVLVGLHAVARERLSAPAPARLNGWSRPC